MEVGSASVCVSDACFIFSFVGALFKIRLQASLLVK